MLDYDEFQHAICSIVSPSERAHPPDAFIQLLRDEAGLVFTRERRQVPTLIVRKTNPESQVR